MNYSRWLKLENLFFIFVLILINTLSAFAGPNRTTYQAKIVKPDGYPLEATNVNFKFTILDPAGTCILYAETYSSVNMTGTGGLISFALGSGVKTFPVSATTFENVFSNITPTITCDAGGPPSYSPLSDDSRKVVMQFHDGAGWQTLPAMAINAVPYAMYANDAQKLGGVSATSFVQRTEIPSCSGGEAMFYNGTNFSCVTLGGGAVSAAAITAALGYTPANGASVTAVSGDVSTLASYAANVSSTVFSVSSTVTSLENSFSSFQATTAASFAALAGSGISTFNGSTSATQSLGNSLSGTTPAFVTANGVHTLNIPYASVGTTTAGLISNSEYSLFSTVINKITSSAASIAQVLGYTPADQATVTTLSSTVGAVSTTANSALALANAVSSSVNSLGSNKITSSAASVAEVLGFNPADQVTVAAVSTTANTALTTANSKITSSAASIAQVLGYVPAASGGISSQWSTSGTTINYLTGRVGVGTVNPEAQLAVETTDAGNHASGLLLRNASNLQNTGVALDFSADADYLGARIVLNRDQQAGPRNSLRFHVNGSVGAANNDDLVIQDSGNVGFGTSNPTRRLHVNENTATSTYAKFTNGAAPTNGLDVGINSAGQGVLYQRENNDLVIGTSDTQRMIIKNSGLIGIGLTSPMTTLDVSGAIRIGMDAVTCSAGYAGSIRYNAGLVEYCNGTIWSAFGVAGAGITNLNGSASGSQTFANGIAGTQPAYISLNGVHTLNIPFAASAGVTAGLLSYADYTSFAGKANAASVTTLSSNLNAVSATATNALNTANAVSSSVNSLASTVANKITSSAASIEQVLGYLPAASGSAINSQWVTSGTGIHYLTGNVGVGHQNPTSPLHTLGSSTSSSTPWATLEGGGAVVDNIALRLFDRGTGAGNNNILEFAHSINGTPTPVGTSRIRSVNVGGNATSGSSMFFETASDSVGTWNSNQLVLNRSGNVGVGVTAPTTAFEVSGIIRSTRANFAKISLQNTTTPQEWWMQSNNQKFAITDVTAGSIDRLTIDTAGNIGIGVVSPTAKLQLAAGTTSLAPFKLSSGALLTSAQSGSIEYDGFSLYFTDGAGTRRALAAESASGTLDTSNINSSGNITMTPTGSVIVSSTTASTNSQTGALIVNGGAGVAGNINAGGNIQGTSFTATGGITSLGRVGVGTSSPAVNLDVSNKIRVQDTATAYMIINGDVNNAQPDTGGVTGVLAFSSDGSNIGGVPPNGFSLEHENYAGTHALAFKSYNASAATEYMRIHNNGNVGIGTSAPVGLLNIVRSIGTTIAQTSSNTANAGLNIQGGGTGNLLMDANEIQQFGDSLNIRGDEGLTLSVGDSAKGTAANGINITSAARVGIGTINPIAPFHANKLTTMGSIGALNMSGAVVRISESSTNALNFDGNTIAGEENIFFGTKNNFPLEFFTNDISRGIISASGNFGIGMMAPSAKLHLASGSTTVAPMKFTSGSLLTAAQSGSLEYNGFDLYFTDGAGVRRALATESNPGVIDASSINSTGNITMTPVGSVIVSSTTASTNSQTGALIVKGGLGIAGNTYSSGTILTSSNIEGNGIKTKGTTAYLEMHDTDTLYSANPQSALVFRDGGNSQYSFLGPSNGTMLWNSFLPIELDTSAGTDLYVSTSGRVGIGTSNPAGLLSLAGAAATDLRMESSSSGGSALRLLAQNGMTYLQSGVSFGAASGADMRFTGMMGTPAWMTIQAASGNVGIGTTNPLVGLHVQKGDANGASLFVQKDSSANGLTFGTHAGSNRGYIQGSNSTNTALSELMLNPYGNSVGINVTSATARLHIASGTASLAPMKLTSGVLLTAAQPGAIEYNGFYLYFTDGAGVRRAIATESNPGVMDASVINSSGNITMTPTGSVIVSSTTASTNHSNGSLIVNGGAGVAGSLNVNGSISTSSAMTIYNAAGLNFQAAAGTPNDPGDIVFRNADGSERSRIYSGTTASGSLVFGVGPAASTKMTILESGTVGIGTTTPLAALEVVRIDPVVRIKNSGGDVGGMYFQNSANSAYFGMYNPGGSSFGVVAANTSKAFLGFDSAGRMGSVTNSFTTGTPGVAVFRSVLDDGNGNMGVASASPGARLAVKGSGATSATIALAVTDSSNNPNLILRNDGNVGLGILAPVAPLHMYGAADISNGNILIQNFQGGSQRMLKFAVGAKPAVNGFTTDDETASITAGGGGDMNLAFGTRNAETMRIDKNGNLGIGTTTPETILDIYQAASPTLRIRSVSNDASSGPVIRLVEDLTGNGALVRYHSINNALELGVSENNVDNVPFTIGRSTGRIGIGGVASATARLHLAAGNASAAPLKLTSGTLLPVAQAGAIEYDGFDFYMTNGAGIREMIGGQGASISATDINSTGNLSLTPTGSVVVSSTTASTNSQTGALIVKGGLGVAGNIYSSGTIITSSNIQGASVTATSGMITPYLAGGTGSGNSITIDPTTHATKGNILLAPNGGNVGIGKAPGTYKLAILGSQEMDGGAGWTRLSLNKTGFNGADIGISSGSTTFLNNTESAGDLVVSNHGSMIFGNNSSLRTDMYIKASNGYVAIGATSAPTSKLHVYDDVNGLMTTRVHNANAGSIAASRLQMGPGAAGNTTDLFISNYGAGYSTGTVLGLLTPANWVEIGTSIGSKGMAIGSSASAPITLITNTTERLRIDSAGRVGIGTSSPTQSLEVSGKVKTNDSIIMQNGSQNSPLLIGADVGASTLTDSITKRGYIGVPHYLNAERNVLHSYVESGSNYSNLLIGGGNSAYNAVTAMQFYTGATNTTSSGVERMRIDASGKVGIGTTTPVGKLEVNGGATGTAGTIARFKGNSSWGSIDFYTMNTDQSFIGDFNVMNAFSWNTSTNSLMFYTNGGQERMRIDSSGRVGIGTSGPNYPLEVSGTARASTLIANDGSPTAPGFTFAGSPTTGFYRQASAIAAVISGSAVTTTTSTAFTINVGTFSTPYGTASNPAWGFNSNSGVGIFRPATDNFAITTASAERFRVTASGAIGIGTTTPLYKLDVSGGAKIGAANGSYIYTERPDSDFDIQPVSGSTKRALSIHGVQTGGDIVNIYANNNNNYQLAMAIKNTTGNVGIGISTPSTKLQVAGDIAPDTTATKTIGTSGLRWAQIYLSNAPDVSSDIRLKKDVQNSDLGLDFINNLRPVSWTWKDPKLGLTAHYGVIAQEAEAAIAKAKGHNSDVIVAHNKELDSYSVRYQELIAPVIKAIQELYHKIVGIDRKIASVAQENAELKARVEKTEKENEELKKRLDRIEKALLEKK